MKNYDFTECDSCRKNAGSPILCTGCLENRKTIYELKDHVEYHVNAMELIAKTVDLMIKIR